MFTLFDGNVIRAGGLVDDGRLTAGEWATFPAVVTDGPLRGAIGYRAFRPIVGQEHRSYESVIVVYRVVE
ncbi:MULTISPECIES: allene oxide cyclase barrel-like domain-containing protein [Nocardiaceae]|uniref:allene oxide cyclase barrel-like domain-containing protein n=1 Tax=Nocardiaceae TaxID=85025 RepID=UPI0015959713